MLDHWRVGYDYPVQLKRARVLALSVLITAVAAFITVFGLNAWAGEWADYATVSMTDPTTQKLTANRLCYTDGRDLACDGAAGLLLTSGTLAITNISATTATISSLWTGNVAASGNVSASTISTTALQIISQTTSLTTCNAANAGTIRYNSPTTALQLCTGTGWVPMGVGVPAGTIAAFASTTCPTGWSEYTAARGRFLRGIDNGAGNDPDGTRAPGATQADMLKSHSHVYSRTAWWYGELIGGGSRLTPQGTTDDAFFSMDTTSTGGPETRPKNVAVTFCVFNGTSNGWNNPLSGGSTVAAGSTGYIQYNTSNAFDANAALTWTNASSRLTATNISATALTVNGVPITGSNSADRIVSTSANVVAGNGGTVSFTTGGVSGTAYFGTLGVLVGPGVSATGTVSAASIYTAGSVQVGGNGSEGCSGPADAGKMRRNPTTGRMQFCR